MVKISVNRYITRRIDTMKREVEANTKRLRNRVIKDLEEIFTMAAKIARGKIGHQRINGKLVRITLGQRKKWFKVAAQAAETIKSITTNLDEQEVRVKLEELEKLVHSADMKSS